MSDRERTLVDQRLGDFEIVREIGRGGMGIVYEARQLSLKRPVALKVLPPGIALTDAARKRFHREAQAAAKLHHSNIVAVYAEGEESGTCYYAMELIEGQAFDRIIAGQPATAAKKADSKVAGETTVIVAAARSTDEATPPTPGPAESGPSGSRLTRDHFDGIARWIADAADALDYAHQQGVIHRDVKPSNLMLGSDGRVRLMDFGLARIMEEPAMTISGEMLGTPRYMSPEQITAGRLQIDHRTDVYSLGATLYELLTLRPPFLGESRDQIIAQIVSKEPRRLRQIDKQIPLDLETICLKALEKDPNRRYQTAGQMAADLRRYVDGYAIAAKRVGLVGRSVKWARRQPTVAALIACVLAVACLSGVFAYMAHHSEQRRVAEQLDRAREMALLHAMSGDFEDADEAIRQAELLGASAAWVRMLRGQVLLQQGEIRQALDDLEQAVKLMPDSAAAQGMLSFAYLNAGQFEQAVASLERLQRCKAVSPEDLLFKGQALAFLDPYSAIQILDEAIHLHDSPMARLVRAWARASHAWNTGDADYAEDAVEDADLGRNMLGDSPYALAISLFAHLVATAVYEHQGDSDNQAKHLVLAGSFAAALELYKDRSLGSYRGWYLNYVGRDDDELEQWRVLAKSNPSAINYILISALYQKGEFAEALQACDRAGETAKGTFLEVARAYVLAEQVGPKAARDLLAELLDRENDPSFFPAVSSYPTIARLLGDNADAEKISRQLKRVRLPPGNTAFYKALVAYNCGEIGDEQFLAASEGSHWNRCEASFHIALKQLAQGNRETARSYFQQAIDTRIFPFFAYRWSQAFLHRMEQDPLWPPWIE